MHQINLEVPFFYNRTQIHTNLEINFETISEISLLKLAQNTSFTTQFGPYKGYPLKWCFQTPLVRVQLNRN